MTQVFSYEVRLMVQVIAESREIADVQMEGDGGKITDRQQFYKGTSPLFLAKLPAT